MPLWGSKDQANNAPVYRVTDKFQSGQTKTGAANAYLNVAVSNGAVVSVVAADVTEAHANKAVIHPGWIVVRQGTGPVVSVTGTGGTGYVNGNIVTVSNGTTNATATVVTNGTGNVASLVVTSGGSGFINTSAIAIAVANSTGGATGAGTGATLTVTLGGRAGRKHMETLVAMGSITGDASDSALV
jgi:hypothetical protein